MNAKRLIDANKLKVTETWALVEKAPEDGNAEENNNFTFAPLKCVLLRDIENAQTVELTETEVQEVLNKRCMTAVANDYLIALHGKIPHATNNAELFKQTFGIYATEVWAMSESKFLEWLNEEGYA